MMVEERQHRIIEELRADPSVSVKELAKKLYVSEPTVRRDLSALHDKGIITKTYGGAMLNVADSLLEIPFSLRASEKSDVKNAIARRAAELCEDGMVIMLDGSTSAYHMVPHLSRLKNITVITSGAKTALMLAEANIRTFCTGGQMIIHSYSYIGEQAADFIRNFYADILFFSCHGLDYEGRMTDNAIDEADLRKVMLGQAGQKVLLCDSGKIGKRCIYSMGSIRDIDEVISDVSLPQELCGMIGKNK